MASARSTLEAGAVSLHIAEMAKTRSRIGKGYDPAKAIARWETDGGAPQGGRPVKRLAIRPKRGERSPPKDLKVTRLK